MGLAQASREMSQAQNDPTDDGQACHPEILMTDARIEGIKRALGRESKIYGIISIPH
jgi:hypothetical protein